ncbi:MAG: MarR family transcriptional regulator [Alphaproteobacteria bacterium]|nr:MarR family transcriptional regulator [Alphaproteobacteria bacterium]
MSADTAPALKHLFLRDEDLRLGIELLFYAYRDFTGEPDRILAKLGFGRAHHRVIYFVGRHPEITVGELLTILRITKQSLSRVLSELLRKGYVAATPGTTDRRQRRLSLTPTGVALERELTENQRNRVAAAYRAAGAAAVDGFKRVMLGLVNETDRATLIGPAAGQGRARSRGA